MDASCVIQLSDYYSNQDYLYIGGMYQLLSEASLLQDQPICCKPARPTTLIRRLYYFGMNREFQYKPITPPPITDKHAKFSEGVVLKYIKSSQHLQPKKQRQSKSKSKSKSTNKTKSGKHDNKIQPKDRLPPILPALNSDTRFKSPIANRARLTVSHDKNRDRERQFKRKNGMQNGRRPRSKRNSKRSTDNQNEQTLIERLKTQNEFYRKAYLSSKQSLGKLEKAFEQQKERRSHQKEWFKYQITNLKRRLSGDRIKLGHIFSYQSFNNDEVSNMIVETENESSSLMNNNMASPPAAEQAGDNLSDLSLQSR